MGRKKGEEEKMARKKKSRKQRKSDRDRFLSPTELRSQE